MNTSTAIKNQDKEENPPTMGTDGCACTHQKRDHHVDRGQALFMTRVGVVVLCCCQGKNWVRSSLYTAHNFST